jgi:TonB family protein
MKKSSFNPKAAIFSVGVHILLLLLCLFIGYTLPATPSQVEELGMEVNLGNSDDGSGTEQAMQVEAAANQPDEMQDNASDQQDAEVNKHLATDETDADAASIKANPLTNKSQTNKNDKHQNQSNTNKPKILFPNQNGQGGNSARSNSNGHSEGNGMGTGDKGVAGGTVGAANYTGIPGTGTGGIGHSFDDRTMIAKPSPEATFREGGRVVVRVTVNREGLITNKRIKSCTNAELGNIALKKIEAVRFNKNESVPPEQFGDITFVFKTRAHK